VGIPVSTADGPSLGLFTNYNSIQDNIKSGKNRNLMFNTLIIHRL
jgi:hypothetical protein